MSEDWKKTLACVLNDGRECLAKVPVACQCRQMPEALYHDLRFRWMKTKEDLPVRKVTRHDFVRAMIKGGATLAEADMQAKVAESLGSQVLVGDEYLEIETK